jgi:hypothetical protein
MGKDCGCGCKGRGDCEESNEMADNMEEARNRTVVRGGRLIRTKRTSMADKQASRKYYRRNKRKIAMRNRKREIKPEFRRNQRANERKKRSLGMVEDVGSLVESIHQSLNGGDDVYMEDEEMMEAEEIVVEDLDHALELLGEQLEEAEELAEEFEGTDLGEIMEALADGIAEHIASIEEGEIDSMEAVVGLIESGDTILNVADSLIE